jgi:hypothetical protein
MLLLVSRQKIYKVTARSWRQLGAFNKSREFRPCGSHVGESHFLNIEIDASRRQMK